MLWVVLLVTALAPPDKEGLKKWAINPSQTYSAVKHAIPPKPVGLKMYAKDVNRDASSGFSPPLPLNVAVQVSPSPVPSSSPSPSLPPRHADAEPWRDRVVCDGERLKSVSSTYPIPQPFQDPFVLEVVKSEAEVYCSTSPPSARKSAVDHSDMLDFVEEEECRARVLEKHCAVVEANAKAHRDYRDDEATDGSLPSSARCDKLELHRLATKSSNYRHILQCSVSGMIDPHDHVIDYCNLAPAGNSSDLRPVAYAIMAHRNASKTARLVRAVYDPDNLYAIHVDQKTTTIAEVQEHVTAAFCTNKTAVTGCSLPANVHIFSKISATWGLISIFDVLRETVELLLALSDTWSHVINLSESDYPLVSQANIRQFLTVYGQRVNFLDVHNPNLFLTGKRWRAREAYARCGNLSYSVHLLKTPPPVEIFDGSMWTMMSREFWMEILSTSQGQWLLDTVRSYCEDIVIPDEAMQQTLVMASSHCTRVCGMNMRLENWQGGTSPAPLQLADMPRLRRSHSFFARKFNDDIVLDAVDTVIAGAVGYASPAEAHV